VLPSIRPRRICLPVDDRRSSPRIDPLPDVVDSDGKLIRPEPVAIAQQQVAALRGRRLLLHPEPGIFEPLYARFDLDANAATFRQLQPARSATAFVPFGGNLLARAVAGIDAVRSGQSCERIFVGVRLVALAHWTLIGHEAEP
jgi:hypothetical protein